MCFLRRQGTGGITRHQNNDLLLLHITMGHTQRCSVVSATTRRRSAGLGRGHTQRMVRSHHTTFRGGQDEKKNNPADLIIDCAWKCGCGAQHINFHLVLYIDDQFMISFSYKCSPNSSINHKHLAGTFCQSFYQMRSGLRWSKYVT